MFYIHSIVTTLNSDFYFSANLDAFHLFFLCVNAVARTSKLH